MSALPQNAVRTGFWIDYSKGSVLGATFTSGGNVGNFIVALLSVLLTFAGSHLWDLMAFAVYLLRSTNHPKDGLHHQHQLLLRNESSPGAYVLESAKVLWCWRYKVRSAWKQFVFPIALALLCSWGFLVAGIFASQIVSTSDIMVLANSTRCGYLASQAGGEPWQSTNRQNELWAQNSALHTTNTLYAQECYNASQQLSQCRIYPVQHLPTSSRTVSCPFEDLCFGTNGTALMQESGLIDSHLHLGINGPPEDRVQWQQRLTCAPLDSNRFLTTLNATDEDPLLHGDRAPLPGEIAYQYALGPQFTVFDHGNLSWRLDNYTIALGQSYTDYILTHDPGYPTINNWNSTVPALEKDQATVVIIAFLSNGMVNRFPVDDPVFAAHRESIVPWINQNASVYRPDNPMGLIACQDEHRFCIAGDKCTAYKDFGTVAEEIPLRATAVQKATLQWVFASIPGFGVLSSGSNIPALQALRTVESGVQWAPLPSNQWEIEMLNLWPLRAAWVQSMPPLIALGASTLQSTTYEQPLAEIKDPNERALCNSIKMQAPQGYVNINVFGLALVVSCCVLIILVNLILTPSFKYAARRRNMARVKRWIQDGMLHVLRKAYEGVGHSDWERTWADVPPTLKAQRRMVTIADYELSASYPIHLTSSYSSLTTRPTISPTSSHPPSVHSPNQSSSASTHTSHTLTNTLPTIAQPHTPQTLVTGTPPLANRAAAQTHADVATVQSTNQPTASKSTPVSPI